MPSRKTSIAVLVIIALVTVTTVVLGALGVFNYLSDRARLRAAQQQALSVNADQMSVGLALPVWNFDHPQINKIVESMMKDRTVVSVVIRLAGSTNIFLAEARDSDGWAQVVTNEPPAHGLLIEERNITEAGETIGSLEMLGTTQYMQAELNRDMGIEIVKILVLDALLTMGLYLLLWRWILRPLQQVEAYAVAVSSGHETPAVIPGGQFVGELEGLRTSTELMVGQLKARYSELQEQARKLSESEDRFRTLIEKAPVAVALARHALNLYNNKMFLEMYGFDSVEELRGRPLAELWAPEYRAELDDRARRREQGLPVPNEYEGVGQRKDGSQFDVHIAVTQVQLTDGPASIAFFTDITTRKQAEERVQRSREQLRLLSSRLQSLREEERIRISREIHDHLGQLLTALKMDMRMLDRKASTVADVELREILARKIASADKLTDDTILSVQKIASELRPGVLDRLGLAAAIEVEAQAFQNRTGLYCEWRILEEPSAIPGEQATAMFRIFQEILTNIARHAQAKRVRVSLSYVENLMLLEVNDDGVGMAENSLEHPKSLGILGMQERAAILHGSVTFDSKPGKGTTVMVKIPLGEN